MKKLPFLAMLTVAICCSFYIDNTIAHKSRHAKPAIKAMLADTAEDLPRAYKKRKFLTNLADVTGDYNKIPGNIVSCNSKDTSYQFRTLKRIIKGDKLPVSSVINNGPLYKDIITSKTSFNGSYLIGGLSVEPNEVMELSIRDEMVYTVPDNLIDLDAIRSAAKHLSVQDRKISYYIKSVTLTSIESKKYTLTKFNAGVNAFYLTLGGKVYSSKEKSMKGKIISMWLVPIQRLFEPPAKKQPGWLWL